MYVNNKFKVITYPENEKRGNVKGIWQLSGNVGKKSRENIGRVSDREYVAMKLFIANLTPGTMPLFSSITYAYSCRGLMPFTKNTLVSVFLDTLYSHHCWNVTGHSRRSLSNMSVTSEPSCDVIAASRHVKTSSGTSVSRDDLYRIVVKGKVGGVSSRVSIYVNVSSNFKKLYAHLDKNLGQKT